MKHAFEETANFDSTDFLLVIYKKFFLSKIMYPVTQLKVKHMFNRVYVTEVISPECFQIPWYKHETYEPCIDYPSVLTSRRELLIKLFTEYVGVYNISSDTSMYHFICFSMGDVPLYAACSDHT